MSRPVLSPVSHAMAAEHRRAFHLLATPIRRLGITLAFVQGTGANRGERLLLARKEFAELPGIIHELELRLPHPDVELSAPRLVFRMGEAETREVATVTYTGDGAWTMRLRDITPADAGVVPETEWMEPSVEATNVHLNTDQLVEAVFMLGGHFLGTHLDNADAEERLAHARALTGYWQLREELRKDGLRLQRPADGRSVTKCQGSFRRSPTRTHGSLTAIIETSKPSLRPGHHRHACLSLRMDINGSNALNAIVHPSSGGDWLLVVNMTDEAVTFLRSLDLDARLDEDARKTPIKTVLGLYRLIG